MKIADDAAAGFGKSVNKCKDTVPDEHMAHACVLEASIPPKGKKK